jgi:hypothetical protein
MNGKGRVDVILTSFCKKRLSESIKIEKERYQFMSCFGNGTLRNKGDDRQ